MPRQSIEFHNSLRTIFGRTDRLDSELNWSFVVLYWFVTPWGQVKGSKGLTETLLVAAAVAFAFALPVGAGAEDEVIEAGAASRFCRRLWRR